MTRRNLKTQEKKIRPGRSITTRTAITDIEHSKIVLLPYYYCYYCCCCRHTCLPHNPCLDADTAARLEEDTHMVVQLVRECHLSQCEHGRKDDELISGYFLLSREFESPISIGKTGFIKSTIDKNMSVWYTLIIIQAVDNTTQAIATQDTFRQPACRNDETICNDHVGKPVFLQF